MSSAVINVIYFIFFLFFIFSLLDAKDLSQYKRKRFELEAKLNKPRNDTSPFAASDPVLVPTNTWYQRNVYFYGNAQAKQNEAVGWSGYLMQIDSAATVKNLKLQLNLDRPSLDGLPDDDFIMAILALMVVPKGYEVEDLLMADPFLGDKTNPEQEVVDFTNDMAVVQNYPWVIAGHTCQSKGFFMGGIVCGFTYQSKQDASWKPLQLNSGDRIAIKVMWDAQGVIDVNDRMQVNGVFGYEMDHP